MQALVEAPRAMTILLWGLQGLGLMSLMGIGDEVLHLWVIAGETSLRDLMFTRASGDC